MLIFYTTNIEYVLMPCVYSGGFLKCSLMGLQNMDSADSAENESYRKCVNKKSLQLMSFGTFISWPLERAGR